MPNGKNKDSQTYASRKRNGVQLPISVSLDPESIARLDKLAKRLGLSRSGLVRRAVAAFADNPYLHQTNESP